MIWYVLVFEKMSIEVAEQTEMGVAESKCDGKRLELGDTGWK